MTNDPAYLGQLLSHFFGLRWQPKRRRPLHFRQKKSGVALRFPPQSKRITTPAIPQSYPARLIDLPLIYKSYLSEQAGRSSQAIAPNTTDID